MKIKVALFNKLYPDSELSEMELTAVCQHDRYEGRYAGIMLDNLTSLNEMNILAGETLNFTIPSDLLSSYQLPPITNQKLPLVKQFERITSEHPDKVAVIDGENQVTYAELNMQVNRLANYLINNRLHDAKIGISGDNKYLMLLCQLAAMKVNSSFVVFDKQDTEERISYILAHVNLNSVIHFGKQTPSIFNHQVTSFADKDDLDNRLTIFPFDNIGYLPEQSRPAYLLYTSGTTANQPKAVIQTQENIIHQIRRYSTDMGITPEDRLFQLATLSHDQAIVDIYGALLNGACLVLADIHTNPNEIVKSIKAHEVTIFSSIPSMFELLFKYSKEGDYPFLRIITIGGEETTLAQARLFQTIISHSEAKLINGYGATECSWIASHTITKHTDLSSLHSFPIGKITEGIEIHILKEGYERGGELYIHGEGISPGYWENPEANSKGFLIADGKKYYRTGDIVEIDCNDNLQFLGRVQWHEKIRGNRVNLKEIEDKFRSQVPDIEVIVFCVGDGMDKQIIVMMSPQATLEKELISKISAELPGFMRPSQIEFISEMPRLPNGKIDRHRIKQQYLSENNDDPSQAASSSEQQSIDHNDFKAFIRQNWQQTLELHSSTDWEDKSFLELGGNSIQAMSMLQSLVNYFEQTFKRTLNLELSNVFNSNLQNWTAYIIKTFNNVIFNSENDGLPMFRKELLSYLHEEDSMLIQIITSNYFSLTINFEAMQVLAGFYNKKYDISIQPCASSQQFVDVIKSQLNAPLQQKQIGLTLPQNNSKNAHPTPCILNVTKDRSYLLISDSVYSPSRARVITPLFKHHPELKKIKLIIDPHPRQADPSSCSIDAIVFLKNMLRINWLDQLKVNRQIDIKQLPADAFKTFQVNYPEHVDTKAPFLRNPQKNLEGHQRRYQKTIPFFASSDVNKDTVSREQSVYLYEKAEKFIEILSEATEHNSYTPG